MYGRRFSTRAPGSCRDFFWGPTGFSFSLQGSYGGQGEGGSGRMDDYKGVGNKKKKQRQHVDDFFLPSTSDDGMI